MKKTLLIFIAFAIFQNGFSQNYDFENWTTDTALNLDGYKTMINDNFAYGPMTVIRSTDSYLDNYSIRLETILTPENDTLFGYFMDGDPETAQGGHPISLAGVDSIVGYYKYSVAVGDTALLGCLPKAGGILTGGGIFPITGTQATWTRFAFYIGAVTADSIVIAAASSNGMADFGIPGSYLMLDDVELKYNSATEPIYNYNFELWSDLVAENLDDWQTANQWVVGLPVMPAQKTTDASHGLYAVELNTIFHTEWNDTLNGMMTNGDWGYNGISGGQPYAYSPTGVEFHYKYAPANNDTAMVSIVFSKNGSQIAWNGTPLYGNNSTYSYWNQVISLPQTPDTLLIVVSAGQFPGSQLKFDNLIFTFPVAIEDAYRIDEMVAYPIPAKDVLNFKLNFDTQRSIDVCIMDMTGRVLINQNYTKSEGEHRISLNVSELPAGVYVYRIQVDEKNYSKQFVVR